MLVGALFTLPVESRRVHGELALSSRGLRYFRTRSRSLRFPPRVGSDGRQAGKCELNHVADQGLCIRRIEAEMRKQAFERPAVADHQHEERRHDADTPRATAACG
jgi:hypothetical protein